MLQTQGSQFQNYSALNHNQLTPEEKEAVHMNTSRYPWSSVVETEIRAVLSQIHMPYR